MLQSLDIHWWMACRHCVVSVDSRKTSLMKIEDLVIFICLKD